MKSRGMGLEIRRPGIDRYILFFLYAFCLRRDLQFVCCQVIYNIWSEACMA